MLEPPCTTEQHGYSSSFQKLEYLACSKKREATHECWPARNAGHFRFTSSSTPTDTEVHAISPMEIYDGDLRTQPTVMNPSAKMLQRRRATDDPRGGTQEGVQPITVMGCRLLTAGAGSTTAELLSSRVSPRTVHECRVETQYKVYSSQERDRFALAKYTLSSWDNT